MYPKFFFTAAIAFLASGLQLLVRSITLQAADHDTLTVGGLFLIDWLYAPFDTTFSGNNGDDIVSFQLIDYRLGNDKGQLVGTGPFAQAPLKAQTVVGVVPNTGPRTQYRLTITCNGKTVYSGNVFSVVAGASPPAAFVTAGAPSSSALSVIGIGNAAASSVSATVSGPPPLITRVPNAVAAPSAPTPIPPVAIEPFPLGATIGGALGGLLILTLLGCFIIRRRRYRRSGKNISGSPTYTGNKSALIAAATAVPAASDANGMSSANPRLLSHPPSPFPGTAHSTEISAALTPASGHATTRRYELSMEDAAEIYNRTPANKQPNAHPLLPTSPPSPIVGEGSIGFREQLTPTFSAAPGSLSSNLEAFGYAAPKQSQAAYTAVDYQDLPSSAGIPSSFPAAATAADAASSKALDAAPLSSSHLNDQPPSYTPAVVMNTLLSSQSSSSPPALASQMMFAQARHHARSVGEISCEAGDSLWILNRHEDGLTTVLNVTTARTGLVPDTVLAADNTAA
ncbi:hypothetical protein HDU88_002380 [Geranomyces variabilis]|nr:hypothetical protein HDU88_002380 [Geranomyces variabilis]